MYGLWIREVSDTRSIAEPCRGERCDRQDVVGSVDASAGLRGRGLPSYLRWKIYMPHDDR